MKSNVSGEDFNLVVWDISNVCHSIRINAYVCKDCADSLHRCISALNGRQLCSWNTVPEAVGRGKEGQRIALPSHCVGVGI